MWGNLCGETDCIGMDCNRLRSKRLGSNALQSTAIDWIADWAAIGCIAIDWGGREGEEGWEGAEGGGLHCNGLQSIRLQSIEL